MRKSFATRKRETVNWNAESILPTHCLLTIVSRQHYRLTKCVIFAKFHLIKQKSEIYWKQVTSSKI